MNRVLIFLAVLVGVYVITCVFNWLSDLITKSSTGKESDKLDVTYSYNPIEEAYQLLVNARDAGEDANLAAAVDEAIGYLGEFLAK